MPFDERRFELFAMKADECARAPHGENYIGLDVDSVGEAVGLSQKDSREIAGYLKEIGWATLNKVQSKLVLNLTLLGYREIAKLRRPRFYRWAEKHPAIVAAVTAICVSVLAELLKRLLLP